MEVEIDRPCCSITTGSSVLYASESEEAHCWLDMQDLLTDLAPSRSLRVAAHWASLGRTRGKPEGTGQGYRNVSLKHAVHSGLL